MIKLRNLTWENSPGLSRRMSSVMGQCNHRALIKRETGGQIQRRFGDRNRGQSER